jgi:hypothetical protein
MVSGGGYGCSLPQISDKASRLTPGLCPGESATSVRSVCILAEAFSGRSSDGPRARKWLKWNRLRFSNDACRGSGYRPGDFPSVRSIFRKPWVDPHLLSGWLMTDICCQPKLVVSPRKHGGGGWLASIGFKAGVALRRAGRRVPCIGRGGPAWSAHRRLAGSRRRSRLPPSARPPTAKQAPGSRRSGLPHRDPGGRIARRAKEPACGGGDRGRGPRGTRAYAPRGVAWASRGRKRTHATGPDTHQTLKVLSAWPGRRMEWSGAFAGLMNDRELRFLPLRAGHDELLMPRTGATAVLAGDVPPRPTAPTGVVPVAQARVTSWSSPRTMRARFSRGAEDGSK